MSSPCSDITGMGNVTTAEGGSATAWISALTCWLNEWEKRPHVFYPTMWAHYSLVLITNKPNSGYQGSTNNPKHAHLTNRRFLLFENLNKMIYYNMCAKIQYLEMYRSIEYNPIMYLLQYTKTIDV